MNPEKDEKENKIETPVEDSPEAPAPAVADLSAITAQLGDASPAPNEAAISANQEKEQETRAQYADLRDSKGNRFDPEIHVTDNDGAPKTTIKGFLRMRPGRKSGPTKKKAGHVAGIPGHAADGKLTPSERMQARATGDAAANALIMLGVVVGGDEWHPQKNEEYGVDEKQSLSVAFGDYFEAKELTDIPPGVALTIAISAYMLPRFTMPKTQTRMQRFKEYIATKIAKRRMRKNNGTQSDSRDDGKRKDDASEESSK